MRSRSLVAVLTLIVLVGCSASPAPSLAPGSTGPPPTRPSGPPTGDFPVLPGTASGVSDAIYTLAARGPTIVGAGWVISGRERMALRVSDDRGATWADAETGPTTTPRDRVREIAAGPDGRWLAVGSTLDGDGLAWTSGDGHRWQRHEIPRTQLDADTDHVVELLAGPDGWLLFGSHAPPGRASRASVWRSTDGRHWRRVTLPGGSSMTAGAVNRGVLVAVGEARDRLRVWRSVDGGVTWRPARFTRTAEHGSLASDVEASSVSAWGRGFRIGGWVWDPGLRPVTLASADGRVWRYPDDDVSLLRARRGASVVDRLAGSGPVRLAAVRRTRSAAVQDFAWWDGDRWRRSRTPRPVAAETGADHYVLDVVVSGDVGVAAVMVDGGWQERTELWRTTDGGRSFTRVRRPWDLTAEPPRQQPTALTRTGDGFLVVGKSRDRMVGWAVDGSGGVSPPLPLSSDPHSQAAVVRGSGDDLLVAGERTIGNPTQATVWSSRGGGRFVASKPGIFQAGGRYPASTILGARRIGGRWFVVGERSATGRDPGALVASSEDGRRWRLGKAVGSTHREGDLIVDDLRGSQTRSRRISDLARSVNGLVAVGAAGRRGSDHPALWRSVDGEHWVLDVRTDRRYQGGQIDRVEARGSVVVAVGSVRPAGPHRPRPWVWRSTDGGRHWSGARLGTELVILGGIVQSAGPLLIFGQDLAARRPVLWKSDDGREWIPVPVDGSGPETRIVDAIPDGDDLVALLHSNGPDAQTTRLVRIPFG